jgi:hypothetical protein
MPRPVNVIVTCTQRKYAPPLPRLQAGRLEEATAVERAQEWTQRVDAQERCLLPAVDLYAGDTWSVVRSILRDVPKVGLKPTLWVCSGGYGLIRHVAPVASYAATFSRGDEDSIIRESDSETPKQQCQAWWQHLTTWAGPEHGQPRSVAELAERSPRTPLLFAGSQTYFDALEPDLVEAASRLSNPDLLSLVSAGTKSLPGLTGNLLPCDARYQLVLGGARQSLNTRLLHMLLTKHPTQLTARALTKSLMENEKNLKDLPTYDRTPAEDGRVTDFIRKSLKVNPKAKHTPLLRRFRDSGFRCEQSRFKSLFKTLQMESHGS